MCLLRLDVKAQMIDAGYPRVTELTFGGVPTDSHDVFLYKGRSAKPKIMPCPSHTLKNNRPLSDH